MPLPSTIFSWPRPDSPQIGMTDPSALLLPVQLDQTLNATLSPDLRRTLKYLLEGWTPRQLELQALRLSEEAESGWKEYDRTLSAFAYAGPLFDDLTSHQIESRESPLPPDDGSTGSFDGDGNGNGAIGPEMDPVGVAAQLTGETLVHFYPDTLYDRCMTEERLYNDGTSSRLEFQVLSRPPTLSLVFRFTCQQERLTFRRRLPGVQVDGQADDGLDSTEVMYTNGAGQPDVGVTIRLRALARTIVDTFPRLSSQRDTLLNATRAGVHVPGFYFASRVTNRN